MDDISGGTDRNSYYNSLLTRASIVKRDGASDVSLAASGTYGVLVAQIYDEEGVAVPGDKSKLCKESFAVIVSQTDSDKSCEEHGRLTMESEQVPKHPNVARKLFDATTEIPKQIYDVVRIAELIGSSAGASPSGVQAPTTARMMLLEPAQCTLRQHIHECSARKRQISDLQLALIASDIAEGAHHLLQHGVDLSGLSLDHVMWTTDDDKGCDEGDAGRAVLLPMHFMPCSRISSRAAAAGAGEAPRVDGAAAGPDEPLDLQAAAAKGLSGTLGALVELVKELAMDRSGGVAKCAATPEASVEGRAPGSAAASGITKTAEADARTQEADQCIAPSQQNLVDIARKLTGGDASDSDPFVVKDARAMLCEPGPLGVPPLVEESIDCIFGQVLGCAQSADSKENLFESSRPLRDALLLVRARGMVACRQVLVHRLEVELEKFVEEFTAGYSRAGKMQAGALNTTGAPAVLKLVLNEEIRRIGKDEAELRSIVECIRESSSSSPASSSAVSYQYGLWTAAIIVQLSPDIAKSLARFGLYDAIALALQSERPSVVVEAARAVRRILDAGSEGVSEAVQNAGIAPLLARMLGSSDATSASVACSAIYSLVLVPRPSVQPSIQQLIEAGALPALVQLLQSPDENLATAAADAMTAVLDYPAQNAKVPAMHAGAIPVLVDLVSSAKAIKLRQRAIESLSGLAAGTDEMEQAIMDSNVLARLVRMSGGPVEFEGQCATSFLCTSRRGSDGLRRAIAEHGALDGLMEIVLALEEGDAESVEACGVALELLFVLAAASTRVRNAFVEAGIIPILVRLLQSHKTDTIAKMSCTAIRNLISGGDGESKSRQAAVDAGVIPVLVERLSPCDNEVALQAVYALRGIARQMKDRRKEILDAGALPNLTKMLDSPNGDESERAAILLQEMINRSLELSIAIIHGGVLPGIVKLLKSNHADAAIAAARVLADGSLGHDSLVSAMLKAGALPELTRMIQCQDLGQVEAAAWAIANFGHQTLEGKLAIAEAGAIGPIVKLISSTHGRTAEYAGSALMNVAGHMLPGPEGNELKMAIVEAGGLAQLLERIQKPAEQPAAYINACKALSNISSGDESCVRAVLSSDVLPVIAEQLKALGLRAPRNHLIIVMGVLMRGGAPARESVLRAGVLPAVVAQLGVHTEHRSRFAVTAVRLLCRGERRQKRAVVAAGALPLLVRMVGPDFDPSTSDLPGAPSISDLAGSALHDLTKDEETCCPLAGAGAIPALIRMMNARTDHGRMIAAVTLKHIMLGPEPLQRVIAASGALPMMLQVLSGPKAPSPGFDASLIRSVMQGGNFGR